VTLPQNFIRGRDARGSQRIEQIILPKKSVTAEFKRRQKTLLNVEIKGSKGDAQERRGVFGAYEFRFDGRARPTLTTIAKSCGPSSLTL
jgi:hypothetical protein